MSDWKHVADSLSAEELMSYTTRLAEGVRLSGSAAEAHVFDYIQDFMTGLGYEVVRHAAEGYIGYPVSASVEAPDKTRIDATGYSLSPGTGPQGISGPLVYIGAGSAADYASRDLRGKVVLCDGMGSSGKTAAADRSGVLAQINIDDEHRHELCVSPVWGSPAPEDVNLLPRTPCVGVRASYGAMLKALAAQGAEICVFSDMVREWRPIPLLTAELPGRQEDTFVLFSGHVDSWHYGAMDNATANASQLGTARILAAAAPELRRGIRFAFWSGHSHGRYAGSTWYADHYWQDLRERCVCHVNVDSLGAVGADLRSEAQTMAETHRFSADILRELANTDLDYIRMSRAGDQSFWGAGVPSMFMLLSEHRMNEPGTVAPISAAVPGRMGANPWFWHTSDDTLDKIDPDVLLLDARIYCAAVWRLCTDPVLPLDYRSTAQEIVSILAAYQQQLGGAYDLSALIGGAEELQRAVSAWYEQSSADGAAARNEIIMALGRALIPAGYTRSGPFYQDPATGTVPLPGIAAGLELARLPRDSDAAYSLRIRLARESNRVGSAIAEAMKALRRARH